MAQSIQDLGDRYVFGNDDGTWTVWKAVTTFSDGTVVGPGYIGKAIFRNDGKVVCGFPTPSTTLNDPNIQGIGIAGWHHYRNIPGVTNIWDKGWDFGGHKAAGSDPFGVSGCEIVTPPYFDTSGNIWATFGVDFVDRYTAAEGKRVARIRYDYKVEPSDVKLWITFYEFPDGLDSSGYTPYIKEPKYAVGLGGATYQPTFLDLFDSVGGLLVEYDLINDPRLQDPTQATEQAAWGPRTRLRWFDGTDYFNVVARGSYGAYGSRDFWAGAGLGLDAFAADANSRAEFDSSICNAYCLQGVGGTLTRKWETAKRSGDPHVVTMLHGWEGGSGLPDCLCAARAFAPGKQWTNYLSVSLNSGWVL